MPLPSETISTASIVGIFISPLFLLGFIPTFLLSLVGIVSHFLTCTRSYFNWLRSVKKRWNQRNTWRWWDYKNRCITFHGLFLWQFLSFLFALPIQSLFLLLEWPRTPASFWFSYLRYLLDFLWLLSASSLLRSVIQQELQFWSELYGFTLYLLSTFSCHHYRKRNSSIALLTFLELLVAMYFRSYHLLDSPSVFTLLLKQKQPEASNSQIANITESLWECWQS